jgi:O-antigen/teichoic acid export membrane protein
LVKENIMKAPGATIGKFITDILGIATSRQKLEHHLRLPIYANSLYILTNNAVTYLAGFVFWIIAARLYAAEAVGLASAALSAVSLIALISLLGLNFSLIRFLAGSGEKSVDLINTSLTIGGLVAAAIAAVFLLGAGVWSPALHFISRSGIFFAVFVIFSMATTILRLLHHTFIARRHAGYTAWQGAIANILKILLVVVLSFLFDAFGIFSSWSLAAVAAVGISILFFLPRVQLGYRPVPVIKWRMGKKIFRFSFLNYISALLWDAMSFLLPIIVVNVLGAEQNAYFYIAWTFGGLLRAIPMSTSLSLFAEGSSNSKQLATDVRRSLKMILVLLLPAIIVVLLVGDKILLLFGQSYSQYGTKLLWLLAVAALPISVNFIYISIKRVQKKLLGVLLLTAFVAIVTLALSYVLLPRYGLLGTGIAWLTAQGTGAVIILANWIRRRRILPDISTFPYPG